jgi:hypothetical protein
MVTPAIAPARFVTERRGGRVVGRAEADRRRGYVTQEFIGFFYNVDRSVICRASFSIR